MMNMTEKTRKPAGIYLIVILGVMAATSTGPIIRYALSLGASSGNLAFYRQLLAALVSAGIVLFSKSAREELKCLLANDIFVMLFSGAIFGIHLFLSTETLVHTTAVNATVIGAMQPIFLLILQYLLFREKVGLPSVLVMFIPIGGVLIIALADHHGTGGGSLYGDFLAILSTLSFAIYFLCGRRVRCRVSLKVYTMVVYVISAIVISILVIGFKGEDVLAIDPRGLALAASIAILGSVIGQSIFAYSLKYIQATTLAMITLLAPIYVAALSFLLSGEVTKPAVYVGGTLITLGIFIFIRLESRSKISGGV